MVGYRRTHNYPHGTPFPLVLLAIVMAILLGLWIFLVPGHWPRAIIAVFLVIAFIDTKLHRHYERTGQAVRIPRPRIVVKFSQGLPSTPHTPRGSFTVTSSPRTFSSPSAGTPRFSISV
jgi:MFS superfamily sulfate permease-like transporter